MQYVIASPESRKNAIAAVKRMLDHHDKTGEAFCLEIDEYKPGIRNSTRRRFEASVNTIANELGMDRVALREYIKQQFVGEETAEIEGRTITRGISTKTLSNDEFVALTDAVRSHFATEYNVGFTF